jgi:hypothetical protein
VALEAIIRIKKALRAIPRVRLIAQVHDEILLEVVNDPTCIAEASAALTTCMRVKVSRPCSRRRRERALRMLGWAAIGPN